MTMQPPIICIDGPSASGKGTVAQLVAKTLNFNYLDSGALYRVVALAAHQNNISWQDEEMLTSLAKRLNICFTEDKIELIQKDNSAVDITHDVRTELISRGASEVAVHPKLREALFDLQRSFIKSPGLVADGRDMGSVVFKEAKTKIYLTASAKTRAERRYKQLIQNEKHAILEDIVKDLEDRDTRDQARTASPLQQTNDALLLDTNQLSISQAVEAVLHHYKNTK